MSKNKHLVTIQFNGIILILKEKNIVKMMNHLYLFIAEIDDDNFSF